MMHENAERLSQWRVRLSLVGWLKHNVTIKKPLGKVNLLPTLRA